MPGADLDTLTLDLASLDAVRAAAEVVATAHPRIDLLIDNAGVMACPFSRTADGFEMQFGTNHLGHFLFTALLLDPLAAADRGVHAFSVHPGVIMTELARHFTEEDFVRMAQRAPAGGFEFKSVEAGAATTVWAATDARLDDHGGAYLEDCGVAHVTDDPISPAGVRAWARDPEQARRLWDLSEELVGQTTDW